MKIAILSVTERGQQLSQNIAIHLPEHEIRQYGYERYPDAQMTLFKSIAEQTSLLFNSIDGLIFIGATGIAVRSIAPLLHDKVHDPAVIVMDEQGKFVIPLISGHIGGANALAELLAERMDAMPVITTATDIGGRFSPDSFAAANGLLLHDLAAAKEVAAAVLHGERVGIQSAYPYLNLPDELTDDVNCRVGICIGTEKMFPVTLELTAKNIVVGIGCKKGTSARQIADAVRFADIPEERITAVATIDIKAHEPGLSAYCQERCIPLHCFSAEKLNEVQGTFITSDFVKNVTGVDNVCERSAVLCSGGHLTVQKHVQHGVTVAAAEMPMLLDFAKRRTL